MRIAELIEHWGDDTPPGDGERDYRLALPLEDAARIEALRLMYPGRADATLMADLIHAALDELEAAMPYVPGERVLAEDDRGAPIYEDLGPTPRFYALSHSILRRLVENPLAK